MRQARKVEIVKKETAQEKENRIFNYYKKDLEKLNERNNFLRFNVIEYVCSFSRIDPYKMAAVLSAEGKKIVYDDSSISKAENQKKERKVKKMIA